MNVRRMEKDDVSQVERIEKSVFSIPWSYQSLLEACEEEENIYLVCEEEGTVVGYCGMWTVLGEGNITNVAVAESARNKGAGTLLMEKLEEAGRKKGIGVFFLEVRESNAAARHVYEKCGFRSIGVRRRFYEKPPEDAVVMSKIVSRLPIDSDFH